MSVRGGRLCDLRPAKRRAAGALACAADALVMSRFSSLKSLFSFAMARCASLKSLFSFAFAAKRRRNAAALAVFASGRAVITPAAYPDAKQFEK
jgi:hypothetical protein